MIINFLRNNDGSYDSTAFNIEKLVANHTEVIKDNKINGIDTVGTGMVALLNPPLKIPPIAMPGIIEWNGSATIHTSEYSLWCKIFIRFKKEIIDCKKDDCVQLEITIAHRYIDEAILSQPTIAPTGHKSPHNTPLTPRDYLFSILRKYVDHLEIEGVFDKTITTNSPKQDRKCATTNIPDKPKEIIDRLIQVHKVLAVSKFGGELLEKFNASDNNCELTMAMVGEVITEADALRKLEDEVELLIDELDKELDDLRYWLDDI